MKEGKTGEAGTDWVPAPNNKTSKQRNDLHTSETCATSNWAQLGLAARGVGGAAPRTGW